MVEAFAQVLGDEVGWEACGEAVDDAGYGIDGACEGFVVADVGYDHICCGK